MKERELEWWERYKFTNAPPYIPTRWERVQAWAAMVVFFLLIACGLWTTVYYWRLLVDWLVQ